MLELLLIPPPIRASVLEPEDLRGRVRRHVLDRLCGFDRLFAILLADLDALLGIVVAERTLKQRVLDLDVNDLLASF